jgi:hypothetical protein
LLLGFNRDRPGLIAKIVIIKEDNMSNGMKLTEVPEEAFAMPAEYERIWKILYSVDQAWIHRLDKNQLTQMARATIQYRRDVASAEVTLYDNMAKMLG